MPTYDYECLECQTRFEARHAIAEEAPACASCGGEARRLILSSPAVHGFVHGAEIWLRVPFPNAERDAAVVLDRIPRRCTKRGSRVRSTTAPARALLPARDGRQ